MTDVGEQMHLGECKISPVESAQHFVLNDMAWS